MGILNFLMGGSRTAEKVVDGVSNGLDAMFFTDEEKSVASQKILDWKLAYAKATAGMSINRRIIVFAVTCVWVLLVILLIGVGLYQGGDSVNAKFLITVMKDIVAIPFSIIVAFYFLAHVVGKGKGQP